MPGDPQFPGAPTATSIHDFPDDPSCGETRQPVGGGLGGVGAGANEFRSDCEVGGFSAHGTGGGDKCFTSLPSGAGTGGGGGGGGKKPFFDKDDVESVLVEHSRKSWWNIFVVCKRIFRYVIACTNSGFSFSPSGSTSSTRCTFKPLHLLCSLHFTIHTCM